MRIRTLLTYGILFLSFISCKDNTQQADYQVIPLPKEIILNEEEPFILEESTVITYQKNHGELQKEAEFLADYINDIMGFRPKVKSSDNQMINAINLIICSDDFDNDEAYRINVSNKSINISGKAPAGVFYGIQTIRKSLPFDNNKAVKFPAGTINDRPRFAYRGMHLDVSRHFFPADSIKVYIDAMAAHNVNRFHLHITDDQGWRMEIKKYPLLTEIGAWRNGTIIGKTMAYDTIRYGGYYTMEELKELVDYAAARHITIIPEIDLPGHMLAALAAYPQYGCTGGPYEVWRHWGISEDVICAGNEEAMNFLEDILSEVMEVFPSEYIHIGGDECPRTRWENCPKCQNKIKELNLKGDDKHSAEDYLQSYVMSRMEKFIEGHGRHIIGWDEMLDGELAPNATVMSWRGSEGGYKAAKMHHNVIMTPNDYLYFDYYQTLDTDNEPFSIGGYNPVKKVYSYEPIPDDLTEYEQSFILGPQANIWTEYTSKFSVLMYRMLPRIGALAEVQWCDPEQKDYEQWVKRAFKMSKLYDIYKWNYATHIFDIDVKITPNTNDGVLDVEMSKLIDGNILYTLDGTDPLKNGIKYTEPLKITSDCTLSCMVVRSDGTPGRMYRTHLDFNKASMRPITLKNQPHKNYTFDGQSVLIDGLKGTSNYRSGRWLGWFGESLDATIDLQQPTEICNVKFNCNINMTDWIFNPKSIKVLVSDDGNSFKEVYSEECALLDSNYESSILPINISLSPVKARYVEVIVEPNSCPEGHSGYGYPAWIFIDEIGVY
ncbi:MAG: family 20 glycosylhydrolase [Candidatus Limimorpha sp.]